MDTDGSKSCNDSTTAKKTLRGKKRILPTEGSNQEQRNQDTASVAIRRWISLV